MTFDLFLLHIFSTNCRYLSIDRRNIKETNIHLGITYTMLYSVLFLSEARKFYTYKGNGIIRKSH